MATDVELGATHNPTIDDVRTLTAEFRPVAGFMSLEGSMRCIGIMFSRGASYTDCQIVTRECVTEFNASQI